MTDPNMPNDPRPPQIPSWPVDQNPSSVDQITPQAFGNTSFINDTTTVQDTIEKSSSIVGRVGLVGVALAIAGSGAFAVTRALSEPAGAQSADEAVVQFFEAVENDDLVGVTEALLPSERESIIDPMIDLFTELDRLDLFDGDADLGAWIDEGGTGLDFSVSGLEFTTTTVGDGVVNARLDAGIVTVRGDVGDLPLGDRADSELGDEVLAESIDEEVVDFSSEEDARFTLIEEDGSWYVSLWYSAAEAARAEAGDPAPNFGAGVVPVGGDSPEAAVRSMMDRAVDLDAEGVIATLDPREFRALYDYAPLFLDDADAAAADARQSAASEGISWSLDRVDLSSGDLRGRTVVRIEGFAFTAEGDGQSVSVDFDGDCVTTIVDREIDEFCLDEISEQMAEIDLPQAYVDFVNDYTSGITVVEREGAWFVSGMPTIIGVYTDLLASLDPQDIDDFTSFFKDTIDGAFDLGDPFLGGGAGAFELQPLDDDPFFDEDPFSEDEPYDPFAEGDPVVEGDVPELSAEDLDTFLPGLDVVASDPEFAYFAGETGFPAASYGFAYDGDGNSIEIVRFDATADQLNAAMDESFAYELVEVDGLPEGATAYDWPEVDRAVVIDNYIVSAYFGDDGDSMRLLLEQVNAIATR